MKYKKQDHAHELSADCGPPSVFLGTVVSYLNTTEGSEAHYHWDDGFTLEREMTASLYAEQMEDGAPLQSADQAQVVYVKIINQITRIKCQ